LKTLLGSISLVGGDHLNETEATRFTSVWITHDVALLDITIFLEKAGHFLLGKTWVDTSDEKVGAWVDSTIILSAWRTTVLLGSTVIPSTSVWGSRSARATSRALIATSWARRCTTITLVTWSLIFVTSAVLVFVIHGSHDDYELL